MLKRLSLNYVIFSILMDVVGVVLAIIVASDVRLALELGATIPKLRIPLPLYPMFAILWLVVAFAASLYDPQRVYKPVDEFQTLLLTTGFYALGMAGLLFFSYRQTSRLLALYIIFITWLFSTLWRALARLGRRLWVDEDAHVVSRVLIVGAGGVGQRVAAMIREHHWAGLQLVGYLDDDAHKQDNGMAVLGTLDAVQSVVREFEIDDVVLALPARAHERVNWVVSQLHTLPVRVRVVPDYFSLALYRATVEDFGGIPMIDLRDPALSSYQRIVKRGLDLVVGGLLTLFFLPVMGVIAVAITLDSPGPVLFKQLRVGENGRLFRMYKFRSMVENAEALQKIVNVQDEGGHLIHKQSDDPRVTQVGRFIRHWSLDELPQFFNVLKGDLSLVGPRPELPWLVDQYEIWQRKRFAVPQGITGWWQVNGRSEHMMHLHTDEDLYYIQNYSLWLDLYILLKTPWVVLRGEGAY